MSEIVSIVQITESLKLLEGLIPKHIDHRGLSGLHAYVTILKSELEDLEEQDEEKQDLIDEYGNIAGGLGLDPSELQSEWDDLEEQVSKLKKAQSEMKEHLAQKFYKHYDEMNSDKLMIARIVGPNLENMVDHMMKENKELQEENHELEKETTAGHLKTLLDEATGGGADQLMKMFKFSKEENKKLKEENENLELQVRQVKNFKIEEFIAAMD